MKNRIVITGVVLLMSCFLSPVSQADSLLVKVGVFAVEDRATPGASQDVTAGLTITRSGLRIDRKTSHVVQTIEFTNSQAAPIDGPLYFVLTGLTTGVTVVNSALTRNISGVGSPYFTLHPADGLSLQPGERLSLTLQFEDENRVPISYTPKVYKTLTTP